MQQLLGYATNHLFKLKPLFALLIILGVSACGVRDTPAAPGVTPGAANTVDKRISSGANDVEEVADGVVTATSERLEIVKTQRRGDQLVGLRFTDIDIPKGTTITNAQLFFTAERASSAATKVSVRGLKNAQPFPSRGDYLSGASKTKERIIWQPRAWSKVGETDKYKTGNLSNVVQELIGLDTWQSGGAMAFVIAGPRGDRSAESFEGNSEKAPRLVIEYDVDGSDEPGDSEAVPIIFDTDFGFDVDDAGALAVLNALENSGEADILAVMAVNTDPNTPGAMDAVNTYYGNPDIPIGQTDAEPDGSKWDDACAYWRGDKELTCPERELYFVDDLAQDFPNDLKSADKVAALPSAVELYRETLAAQPDNSVTVVAVGFMQNLAGLLESQADQYSDLNGVELVEQKVKQLVIMGASYPGGDGDFNLTSGRTNDAGQQVAEEWPTTIAFTPGNSQVCGYDNGEGVIAGDTLDTTPTANPVRKAYELFSGGNGRDAWDLCAVLYGVRGTTGPDGEDYFKTFDDEKVVIENDRSHRWVSPDNDRHERVWREGVMEDDRMEEILNGLLTQAPKEQPDKPDPGTDPGSDPKADWFVSPDGSDDSNSGEASDEAFATLQKALDVVSKGQTIYLAEGTYKLKPGNYKSQITTKTDGGSSEAERITIRGASTSETILDGNKGPVDFSDSCGHTGVLKIQNPGYTVENLTVTNSGCVGIQIQKSDNTIISNVASHSNGEDGIYSVESNNVVIEYVEAYGNYKPGSRDDGGSGDGIKVPNGNNVIVRYNRTYKNFDDGIDMWQTVGAQVHHNVSYENGCATANGETECSGSGNGSGFKLGGGGGEDDAQRRNNQLSAHHNIAFRNNSTNLSSNGNGGIAFYNNTSYNDDENPYKLDPDLDSADENYARNNISYPEGEKPQQDQVVQSNNSWTPDLGIDLSESDFVSLSCKDAGFLELASSNPGVDEGVVTISSEDDISVAAEAYRGDAPDLGALELGENLADWDLLSTNEDDPCYGGW